MRTYLRQQNLYFVPKQQCIREQYYNDLQRVQNKQLLKPSYVWSLKAVKNIIEVYLCVPGNGNKFPSRKLCYPELRAFPGQYSLRASLTENTAPDTVSFTVGYVALLQTHRL